MFIHSFTLNRRYLPSNFKRTHDYEQSLDFAMHYTNLFSVRKCIKSTCLFTVCILCTAHTRQQNVHAKKKNEIKMKTKTGKWYIQSTVEMCFKAPNQYCSHYGAPVCRSVCVRV